MQYSIIYKNETVSDFRLDAEAYLPIYLNLETTISKKSYTTFEKECSTFTKGIFDIRADCYLEKGGVPFVRISDLGDILLKEDQIVNIPGEENNKNKKTYLERGDLILSKTAYPAACFVDIDYCNVSQDTIAVKLKKDSPIRSHFLSVFLNTKYGLLQMQRWFTGNVQMHLNLSDSKKIRIPVIGNAFQDRIEKVVEDAIQTKKKTQEKYGEAEQVLLSELGLLNWKPKHRLSFIKNFSDTQSSDRIDAEYFQPMYDEVVAKMETYKNGCKPLGEIIKIKDKNFMPKDEVLYKYVELANISTNGDINGFIEAQGQELPTRARRKVNAGDVIVSSIEGSLSSIALIGDNLDNALCSTGFFVVNSDEINSESLLVLLKSSIGQLQLKKGCSGTILTAINDDEFRQITFPNLSASIQEDIKKKITTMYNAKALSKRLLDIAKCGVERAIEKNEREAEKWINLELEKLGVKL